MAAVNTEVAVQQTAGVKKVYGTAETSGGSTSVIIAPGYDANGSDVLLAQGSVNANAGLRRILGWSVTNNASSSAFKAVKSFDGTADRDIITITCTANDTFDYTVEGIDEGNTI